VAYLKPAAGAARASAASTELDALLSAIPAAVVADIAASTDITAVPASFADLAAVRTYLAGANAVPNIEARLDAIEAKVNTILARLRTVGVLASS
jgi:hypothetical protein